MIPVGVPKPAVRVEYDKNGKRASRMFKDAYEARRFYVTKFKLGRNPAVKKENERVNPC